MQVKSRLVLYALSLGAFLVPAGRGAAQSPAVLFTPAASFASTNHYVAASVFVWFTSTGGQLSGPWRPLEGRANWTGQTNWWQGQIKQMMMANIDVLYVHLYRLCKQICVNGF